MTKYINIKENSQKFNVGYFWFYGLHFRFLLLNKCPKTRILISKQTKKAITVTLLTFAIYVKVVICT